MKSVIDKCTKIVQEHCNILKEELSVKGNLEIFKDVKKEHYNLGKNNLLEGVCSDLGTVTIYPTNIWNNHCGLLPEPYNWKTFEEESIRVIAHEMRHLWQLRNELFYSDNAEEDADEFASQYVKRK